MATRTKRSAARSRGNGGSARGSRSSGNGHAQDILNVLKTEHRQVQKMLKELVNAEEASEREEIFGRLKPELEAHTHGENDTFYPALKEESQQEQEEEATTAAIEGFVEHDIAERLLKEMDGMDKEGEEWGARAKVLKDLVDHHIEEEESELWKEARKVLGKERLAELAPEYMAAKEKYM